MVAAGNAPVRGVRPAAVWADGRRSGAMNGGGAGPARPEPDRPHVVPLPEMRRFPRAARDRANRPEHGARAGTTASGTTRERLALGGGDRA